MINFDCMPCKYWSISTKISYLQRRIIVYSIMYYELNESCVSDFEYDSISHQLVELQNKASKKEFEESMYYYAMYDFDGSTGFDIPSRLNLKDKEYITELVYKIYRQWKEGKESGKIKRSKK